MKLKKDSGKQKIKQLFMNYFIHNCRVLTIFRDLYRIV